MIKLINKILTYSLKKLKKIPIYALSFIIYKNNELHF